MEKKLDWKEVRIGDSITMRGDAHFFNAGHVLGDVTNMPVVWRSRDNSYVVCYWGPGFAPVGIATCYSELVKIVKKHALKKAKEQK
jgi:hypothetical protein